MEDTEPDDEGEEYKIGKNIIHNNFYNQNFIKKFFFENIERKEIDYLKRDKKSSNNNKKFIVHLVPSKNSSFYNFLQKKKNDVLKKYGQDETYKYDIHISVTGYFGCDNINVFIQTLYHFMFQYVKLYYTFKKVIFRNLYYHISLPNKAEVESFILKKEKIKYEIKTEDKIQNVNPNIFKKQTNYYYDEEDQKHPPGYLNQKQHIIDIRKKDITYTKNNESEECVQNNHVPCIKETRKKNTQPTEHHVITTNDGYVIVPIHCEWLKRILENFFFIIKNNNIISYNTITNGMYTINNTISKVHDSIKKKNINFSNNKNILSYDPYKCKLLLLTRQNCNSNISSNTTSNMLTLKKKKKQHDSTTSVGTSNMDNTLDIISSSGKCDILINQYSEHVKKNYNNDKKICINDELTITSFGNINSHSNNLVDPSVFNKTITSMEGDYMRNTLICNNKSSINIINNNNNNNNNNSSSNECLGGASHMEKNNLSSNKSDSSDKTNNSKKEKRKKKSNHNNHNNNNNNKRTDTQRKDTLNNMKYKYNNFKVNVSDFRVKDCNHISLACNRNNKYIQKNIANMYKDLKYYFLNCSWDLVMFECDENVFPQTNKQNKFLNEILRVKNFAVS
ncbi:hypothetical protein CYL21_3761 [Plasmodium falciparum NF54]|uniref:Uncharacterized protein n=2 Tax=Plasmodium falciparum TaxID=5833 RepID=Q8IJL5_PLAF7|nr:conserved Plasmodium protein, unknown function [Plasmodium falciparum 3D7]EWC85799.1 hypothetical protein PFNF54_05466 [Plasmodium falciparum NF54]KAF4328024.1 hypothetical protein CYL21_3761 [Plasmodium falciparum NF54]PKC43657.1 hypothetical protein CK202_4886 [Plasmodium falciparum NF54]CZT98441.1 conserved Plasmodium protein, unknown function [Plasmodium falciparum 3D7]|eukprot:XP_001347465.1 conserved Plasmodium protein, unknown function [Plasmodium falciparum 3D7]